MKEIVSQEAWRYTLEHDSGRYYLSVLCGSVGLYEVKIELTRDEIIKYRQSNKLFLDELIDSIQNNPNSFKIRNGSCSD